MDLFDGVGCVIQVLPLLRTVVCWRTRHCGFLLAPAPDLGNSALSLAPCVRRDVHWADLQVGWTLLEWEGHVNWTEGMSGNAGLQITKVPETTISIKPPRFAAILAR